MVREQRPIDTNSRRGARQLADVMAQFDPSVQRSGMSAWQIALLLILVFIFATGTTFGALLLFGRPQEVTQEEAFNELDVATTPLPQEERENSGVPADQPRFISIPALGLKDAPIVALGVLPPDATGSQQMDDPKNIEQAGWYNCQINPVENRRCADPTAPGDGDTAQATVLDGHTCFTEALQCVFDGLTELKSGDTITIEMGDGKKFSYEVRSVEVVPLEQVNMARFMQPFEEGKAGLNMITCAGDYVATDSNGRPSADHRAMVYAVPVEA